MEGNEGSTMHDGIQINRMADRFSSHTLAQTCPAGYRTSADTKALRERLVAAAVEVLCESSDPRLDKTLVRP